MEKEKFEKFAALLENEKAHMYPGVTFRKMCGWAGADEKDAEAVHFFNPCHYGRGNAFVFDLPGSCYADVYPG